MVTSKGHFAFSSANNCQGQLQSSQSLSIAAVCLHCWQAVRLQTYWLLSNRQVCSRTGKFGARATSPANSQWLRARKILQCRVCCLFSSTLVCLCVRVTLAVKAVISRKNGSRLVNLMETFILCGSQTKLLIRRFTYAGFRSVICS